MAFSTPKTQPETGKDPRPPFIKENHT